jgi:putative transposase
MCRSRRCAPAWSDARATGAGRARAHLSGKDDGVTAFAPARARIADFAAFLVGAQDAVAVARLRAAESIGRPLGDARFLARIERLTKRRLRPGKRGPKPREN